MTPPATPLRTFPRTFRLGNWPLIGLFTVLGLVPALVLWRTGSYTGVGVVGGVLMFAVFLSFFVQLLVELFGTRFVSALHQDGFVARRLFSQTFVSWADVERVKASSVVVYVQGETVRQEVFDVDYGERTPARVTAKEGGAETAEFIVQHAGLAWEGDIAERQ
jgi:hypothetical protein